ncbi:MAG TPA: SURF1 family protein, partial [Acidimicrobiales bacterium]
LVVLLIVTMVNLGFWQLRRLDERRDRNALVEARMDQPVVPIGDLLDAGGEVGDARYRRVTAAGGYDDAATVVVRNRSQGGVAGAWLVTPLELDAGDRVGVLRGFVPLGSDGSPARPPVPGGEVTVEGLVVDPGSFDGTAPRDLAPLLAEADVLPGLVLAESSDPPEPAAADPVAPAPGAIQAVDPPDLSEGPHLGYAAQWFVFSAIAVVGYPLVLRRVVARRGKEVDDLPAGGPPDDLDAELEDLLRRGG